MSGEQAEERTAREPMTKHADSSRSTDSGVSGNAQTSVSEIREPRVYRKDWWCLFYACKSGQHDDCKAPVSYSGTSNGLPVIVTQRCTCDCHPKEVRRG